ncbi:MAG: O-antigen ligase family protein [Candidatus Marinimicrobia bacterium]|nr:O-antigen ligase family protein [Candidatus Neomarinimicrobiota bacterium]
MKNIGNQIQFYLVLLLLIVMPFDVGPNQLIYFNILGLTSILALAIWFFQAWQKSELVIRYSSLLLPIGSLLGIMILSNFWTIDVFATHIKSLTFFFIFSLFWIINQNPFFKYKLAALLDTVSIYFGLLAVIGLYQFFWIEPQHFAITDYMRAHSVFVWPNTYAGYIVLLWPVILIRYLTTKQSSAIQFGFFSILMLGYAALIATYSRGGWLSFGLVVVFLIILMGKQIYRYRRKLAYLLSGGIIITIIFINLPGADFTNRLESIGSQQDGNTFGRVEIWSNSLEICLENPLLGTGLRTFHISNSRWLPHGRKYDFAHNDYLQIFVELGLIGLAVLIWFMIRYFIQVWKFRFRPKNSAGKNNQLLIFGMIAGTGATMAHSFIDYDFYIPGISITFWFLMAVIISNITRHDSSIFTLQLSSRYVSTANKKLITATLAAILTFITLTPAISDYAHSRGQTALKEGNLQVARSWYRTASGFSPRVGGYHSDLASVISIMAEQEAAMMEKLILLQLAEAEYSKSTTLNPYTWDLWYARGMFLDLHINHFIHKLGYSRKTFESVDTSKTGSEQLWLNLPAMFSYFSKAIALYPNNRDSWLDLGRTYLNYQYYDSALVWHERYLAANSFDNSARTSYSEALLGIGDFNNSITNLEMIIESDTSYSYAWYLLGENYLNLSNFGESTFCFQKAIQTGSDTVLIKQKIENLISRHK